jgi:hypothetical protein
MLTMNGPVGALALAGILVAVIVMGAGLWMTAPKAGLSGLSASFRLVLPDGLERGASSDWAFCSCLSCSFLSSDLAALGTRLHQGPRQRCLAQPEELTCDDLGSSERSRISPCALDAINKPLKRSSSQPAGERQALSRLAGLATWLMTCYTTCHVKGRSR